MVENGYNEDNIENISVDKIIQNEIEDRKYNHCTSVSYDIKYISNYYFNKYQKYILYNVESVYNKLEPEYRKEKFPTLQEYRKYVNENINNILKSQIASYSVNNTENYKDYICEDQFGNKYTFRETGVNEYTIILSY